MYVDAYTRSHTVNTKAVSELKKYKKHTPKILVSEK